MKISHRIVTLSAPLTLLLAATAFAATEQPTAEAVAAPESVQAPTSAAAQEPRYETPDAAIQALLDAVESGQAGAITKVLGPDASGLGSGDDVADAKALQDFLAVAAEAVNIEQDENDPDHAVVTMGNDDWPFPIPLVHDAQGWYFDTVAGKEEIYNRRVGRNELSTIETLRAFVDAEDEYASEDRSGDGIKEYARKLMSTEGTHDGLYWLTAEGDPPSPMGRLVAEAVAEGYKPGQGGSGHPYHGYVFRGLTAQGPDAPGGARDYLVDGHLTGGFALVAYPAQYGNSGIMTFMVNQSGIVYQKDLGPDTSQAAAAITAYDPGEGWSAVAD